VAIICALPLEAENVQSVFDKCWEDEDKQYGKAVGDQNSYTTGVIGKYNVVLVHMPSTGSNSAALSAAGLRSSFPEIKLALVVGVCGVVPVHVKTKEEIVLGDVIISTAVTQYDFGRQYPHGFERKMGIEDSLGRAKPRDPSVYKYVTDASKPAEADQKPCPACTFERISARDSGGRVSWRDSRSTLRGILRSSTCTK
jgi:nucleoside phosphorylase